MKHNYFTEQEKASLKTLFQNVFFVYVLASLIYLMPDIVKLLAS